MRKEMLLTEEQKDKLFKTKWKYVPRSDVWIHKDFPWLRYSEKAAWDIYLDEMKYESDKTHDLG